MHIVEVGPRDGLQNEKAIVETKDKIALINALNHLGVQEIEVSAFVSAKRIPQLYDAEKVFDGIERSSDIIYSALVPNIQGLERAMAVNVDKLCLFSAATETFNEQNIHTSIDGSIERFKAVLARIQNMSFKTRGYISTAFYCPFEGKTPVKKVRDLTLRLLDLGVDECAISDTIGKASQDDVSELFEMLLKDIDPKHLAAHFHDTYGNARSNIEKAYDLGIRTFDGSIAGLGGCPYAPGASGNVSTRHVFEALQTREQQCTVNTDALNKAEELAQKILHKTS
jgi:hydroxymethylglutaryl-CoA lyase